MKIMKNKMLIYYVASDLKLEVVLIRSELTSVWIFHALERKVEI